MVDVHDKKTRSYNASIIRSKNTTAEIIETSPNVKNISSQKMAESVGGREVRKSTYHFPKKMQHFTEDVDCIIYHIQRKIFLKQAGE